MSDGMTDTRSQTEYVMTPKQLQAAKESIESNLFVRMSQDSAFSQMTINDFKQVVSFCAALCVAELRKIEK